MVVDDFGDVALYRQCSKCHGWFELGVERWTVKNRDKTTGRVVTWHAECRACQRARARAAWASLPFEERQERDRKIHARRREADRIDAERARRREYARERRKNPAFIAKERKRQLAYRARVMRQEPEKYAERLEAKRIRRRLARIAAGLPVRDVVMPREAGKDAVLPVAPLVAVVSREAARQRCAGLWTLDHDAADSMAMIESVCERLGFDGRTFRRWQEGASVATFNAADSILTALHLNWWDVWNEQTTRRPLLEVLHRRMWASGGSQRKRMRVARRSWYGDAGPDTHGLALVRWKFEGGERPVPRPSPEPCHMEAEA